MLANQPSIFIIGAGPQIAASVASLFATNGFSVGLSSRSTANLERYKQLLPEGTTAATAVGDANDPSSLVKALQSLKSELGAPSVIVYNAGSLPLSNPPHGISLMGMTPQDVETHMRLNVVSGFAVIHWAMQNVVKDSEGRSAILITSGGLALEPMKGYAGLSAGKAALLNLVKSFRLEDPDIHIATVLVNGYVDSGDPYISSPVIAKHYWELYTQKKEDWVFEVVH